MKFATIAATALLLSVSSASAGGWEGWDQPASPQIANSSAMNLAIQSGSIRTQFSQGDLKQVTGAGAESLNHGHCGCTGTQTANSVSKNVSIQVGQIGGVGAHTSYGSISQSAVSTSFSSNTR